MQEERMIEIKDGISVTQQRQLIEVTTILARALTETEFRAIMSYYGKIADRLSEE